MVAAVEASHKGIIQDLSDILSVNSFHFRTFSGSLASCIRDSHGQPRYYKYACSLTKAS